MKSMYQQNLLAGRVYFGLGYQKFNNETKHMNIEVKAHIAPNRI